MSQKYSELSIRELFVLRTVLVSHIYQTEKPSLAMEDPFIEEQKALAIEIRDEMNFRRSTRKLYYTQHNIGTAKYVVNTHNGVDSHSDGSPFWGIAIFSNKKKMDAFVRSLERDGYECRR